LTRSTGPLQSDDVVDAIGADLRTAGYTTDGVADLLGADASAALDRGVWWPAIRATQTATCDRQPLAVAVRLFLLGSDEPRELLETALPSARVETPTDNCADIVATDTNERALSLAAATARFNGMSWDLRHGSLFEPVAGERFDLIVSNPPLVVGAGARDYLYRDSGVAGDTLCQNLIEQVGDHLEPGGTAQIMANWIGAAG
jgi:hypothetical protein